ncbi:VirB4 family type IV secretion/conjugal transfer ATPase [Phenylobacterium deserti]|uniref:Type IV secretion system protein virB4 n=1 Tax=Phenylobacterium deserti TaxID=1914756 RepID=A0A328ACQ6_9CAUL|nr:VirB4 family type IV secretion/conjugal transfer ATPase [Phenylobacterium deserti]RAK52420.1 VirB4 family type IV secretion/conjugal transfer ATPase [Phenylobacterium deserti]
MGRLTMSGWAKTEALAGDRLPYRELIDENVVLLRDGSVMVTLLVPGVSFETADTVELNAHTATREVLLRSSLDARFILYHHVIRRRVQVELDGAFTDPVAAHLDARWREKLSSGALFVNDQFVTLVRRPARGKTGWVERIGRKLRKNAGDEGAPSLQDLRELRAAASAMVATLGSYGARLLGDYKGASGACSEVLEFLSALYNGEMRPVRKPGPHTDVGRMLPYKRVNFGLDALELKGAGGASFASLLSLKDYPDTTAPGITDNLLRIPCEMVLTESYAPCDRQIARERIDLSIRRLRSADEEAMAERAELHAARDALGVGSVGFGDHHLSVLVRTDSLEVLDEVTAACASALGDAGAVAVREEVNLEPAFWGQIPGNEAFLVRRALISSANMACFGSLHGFSMGQADGAHWGEPVAILETTSATPFFFNFHNGDLGNFTVIGPSGSGKTVVMNFLAAQAQRFAPRTVLFDKDRGAEVFVRGIGGRYNRIAAGEPTGFNPLALPDRPANRAFLREWLGVLLQAGGAEEHATIAAAVDAAYANDPSLRRLSHFRELLAGTRRPQPGDLAHRLDAWIGGGEHGWLFDNAEDELDLSARTLGFDMTALLETPRLRTPVMMYLFHRIEERLDGTPTMILIDEGWKALDDEVFAARIRDWLKTLRKRNALVGFATQSARDALDSRISTALVEQTATMIFTPNAKARAEDYCGGFGLSEHELEVIRTLPAQSRCFLVRQPDASAVVRLDLAGMPDVLTLLSGREATVRKLDRLRAAYGDEPAAWYSALTGAPWPGEELGEPSTPVWKEAAA